MTQARNLSRLLNKDITTYMYTATAGQTVFTGSDTNSQTLTIDNQSIMVTYNGVMLEKGSEFTVAVNTVTLLAGAEVNAEVNVIVFNNASLGGYVKSTGGDIDGGVNITKTSASSLILNRQTTDGDIAVFRKDGSTKGSISVNSAGTTYNTTSDRRLKDNIQPISDATDKLMDMKPVTHTWIDNPDEPQVHGFIAQEMQEIVPEAVSGDAESDEIMSMDYGRITPVIVAALQDALNEIKELKTRIDELENK